MKPVEQASPGGQSASPAAAAGQVAGATGSSPSTTASSSLSIVFSASWVRLLEPIGEGAFSKVHRGVYLNPESGEESVVAVKILKKNMLKRRSDCLRFIKEAKIMTKISHKHIAACYGIGKYEDDDPHNPGSLFIVQELIRGGNLLHKVYKQMLNRFKCVYTSQEALEWMIDVASGMQYLHAVSDTKPMIIHRDLKLENIMLAVDASGVSAKLVDFGLHKVIDDRIKKVVKRVISEANLGLRLSRLRNQHAENEDGGVDMDDELEMALAEQQAMVEASSVKPGVGPAALSPLGGSPASPLPARFRQTPLRVTSRMTIECSQPSMSSMPEEADEEELAIQQAQAQQEKERQEKAARERAAAAGAGLQQHTNGGVSMQAGDGSAAGQAGALPASTQHSNSSSFTSCKSPLANSNEGGVHLAEPVAPALAKIRAPVKKQSSMQKLMAKMKEIKLRVTGTRDTSGTGQAGSMLSRTSHPGSPIAAGSEQTSQQPQLSLEQSQSQQQQQTQQQPSNNQPATVSPTNQHAIQPAATTSPSKLSDGGSPGRPRKAGVSFGGTTTVTFSPTSGADVAGQQMKPAASSPEAVALQARMAKNVQLLDQIVKQQSVAHGESRNNVLDDLGLIEGGAAKKVRAPPRRAVTMINEIRYNLTEAVGSWAYMAPEVVLGQPYNEKVDVFSFGVIMFEVLNRKLMLVDEIKNDPRKDAQAYAERVARGFRPEIPRSWPAALHELISACWAQDPHCRPNFAAVVDALQELSAQGLVACLDARYMSKGSAFI